MSGFNTEYVLKANIVQERLTLTLPCKLQLNLNLDVNLTYCATKVRELEVQDTEVEQLLRQARRAFDKSWALLQVLRWIYVCSVTSDTMISRLKT